MSAATRRGFLKSILAAGVSPAIVRAESLMKIWVPPQGLLFDGVGDSILFITDLTGDYTIETFAAPSDEWVHVAVTRKFGELSMFLNGKQTSVEEISKVTNGHILSYVDGQLSFKNPSQEMNLCDVKVTDGVVRNPNTFIPELEKLKIINPFNFT
jgi:hypothetical protein